MSTNSNKIVFLGGTCNNSQWREKLIPLLSIGYFNPVVENWTPECQEAEIKARETSDYVLYVITPKMTGVYSIAEVVDDSNKRPEKTVFAYLLEDDTATFEAHQVKALKATAKLVESNGAKVAFSLEEVAELLK